MESFLDTFLDTFFDTFLDSFLDTLLDASLLDLFLDASVRPFWMLFGRYFFERLYLKAFRRFSGPFYWPCYLWSSFKHAFSKIISIHCEKWTPSFFSQVKGIFLPSFISVSYCQSYLWSCKSSHFYRLLSFDPTKKITCLQLYNYVCIFCFTCRRF